MFENKYLYCKGPGPVGRRVDILVGDGTGHGVGAGTFEGLGIQEVRRAHMGENQPASEAHSNREDR